MHKHAALVLSSVCKAVLASAVFIIALSPIALASDVKVMCTQALKGTMAKLGPLYERETGNKLLITYGATAQLLPAINKGEPVDVIIVVKPMLAELAKSGKVVESSQVDIARSGVGIAIRPGSVRPDISTVDAFKNTLLAARSIAYTNPADGGLSAVHFAELINKLGIADQLRPKTKFAPGGTSSAALVVSGEADLAVQFISELLLVPGVEIAGPLPPEIQRYIVVSAGVSEQAADPVAAGRLVRFLSSPAVGPLLPEAGLEAPK
jgi:molybdate transport system substrate-binding protein